MFQYLSRIEGPPPKRNVAGSIPVWNANRFLESLDNKAFGVSLCKATIYYIIANITMDKIAWIVIELTLLIC